MISVKNIDGSPFKLLYDRPPDVDLIVCIGGRGGKKTYEVSKFGAFSSTIKKKRVAVLRDEKETIRESILNEIFSRYDSANKYGHFEPLYDKLETGIRDKQTGEMLVFTKGFRASSNEKRTNMKGISEVDIAIVEEAEDIRSFEKFSTFKDSVRTRERLIVVILNTPDLQHWIVKRYFNAAPITFADIPARIMRKLGPHITEADLDGYYKLSPKDVPGFRCIQTSYLDNQFLSEGVVRDYESYGDPTHPAYDLHYFLTAIMGFASSGRKGQILKKVKPISLADYIALPFREIYGQDFGTKAPAGLVGVKMDGNNLYARELNYLGLDALGLAKLYCRLGLGDNDLIIADSAEPLTIGKLRRGFPVGELSAEDIEKYPRLMKGFFIRGAVKGTGSVDYGLQLLTGMNLYFVTESVNLWNEVYNYVYAQNKEGEYTNDPEEGNDHLIDPIRYVRQSRGRFF
jgi:phage terminase large subunit